MLKAILVDFDDSFTFNIVSELYGVGIYPNVISHHDLHTATLDIFNCDSKTLIIFGPGPGNPEDYQDIFPILEKILIDDKLYFMAICLGHQILWRVLGEKIKKMNRPIHGDTTSVNLFDRTFSVQKYNSLTVDLDKPFLCKKLMDKTFEIQNFFSDDGELMASLSYKFITYQFHPESIGTSCRRELFLPVLKMLYNVLDERSKD